MPTYAYACTECDHRFEAVQSFSDDSLTVCPECEGRLRKVFNAVGIVFKGGGFYRTDSRSGSSATAGSGSSNLGSDSSSTVVRDRRVAASGRSRPPGSSSSGSSSSGSSSSKASSTGLHPAASSTSSA